MLDNLPPKTKTTVIALSAVVLVGTILVGYNIVYRRFDTQAKTAALQIDTEIKKKALIEEVLLLRKKTETYRPHLVSRRDPTWLIEELNRFAGETGVSLSTVTPQAAEIGMDFERVSVKVEANGDYHRLGGFIAKIETYKPFLKIGEIRFSDVGKSPNAAVQKDYLRALVTISAFRALKEA